MSDIPDREFEAIELIEMLDEIVKKYEDLPTDVMLSPVSHADYVWGLKLMSEIMKRIDLEWKQHDSQKRCG